MVEGKLRRRVCCGMMQYVKGTQEQYTFSPLGEENQQKVLYLGQASVEIVALEHWIAWKGKKYQVVSAHPVYCGGDIGYWRGILKEMAEDCGGNVLYPEEETLGEEEKDGDGFE